MGWQSLFIWGVDWFFVLMLAGFLICLAMLRYDMVGHRYEPVLFDRAARKVHLFMSQRPVWWQPWRWWPTQRIESFDWACVRAEVVETTHTGGLGLSSKHYGLMLAVTESPGSTRVRIRFGVGLGYPWNPEPALGLWDHLRQFMAGGAHVVPGDTIFLDRSLQSFWRSLSFMQPLLESDAKGWLTGSAFGGAWWFSLPASFAFLVILPFTAACGLIRWVTHQMRREPRWPAEILASVGEVVDVTAPRITWTQRRKALKAQQNGR